MSFRGLKPYEDGSLRATISTIVLVISSGVFIFIKNRAAHEESVDELLTPQLKLEQQINRTPEQKAYNYEEEYNKMIKKSKEEYELFMKQREHLNKNNPP